MLFFFLAFSLIRLSTPSLQDVLPMYGRFRGSPRGSARAGCERPGRAAAPALRRPAPLPGAEQAVAGPEPLRGLDVRILHALILEEIPGIDRTSEERPGGTALTVGLS